MTDPTRAALVAEIEADRAEGTPGSFEVVPSIPEDGHECYWIRASNSFGPMTRGFRVTEVGVVNGPQWREQAANARRIANVPRMEAQIIADAAYIAELEVRVRELVETLRPFSSCVFNDNGDVTITTGHLTVQDWLKARRALNKEKARCRKCGAEMKPGIAMGQTYTGGVPDFPGEDHSATFSAGGPGRVVECLKCSDCGWSVEKADE